MTIDFQIILITLLTTLYFILPAYFANGGLEKAIQMVFAGLETALHGEEWLLEQ